MRRADPESCILTIHPWRVRHTEYPPEWTESMTLRILALLHGFSLLPIVVPPWPQRDPGPLELPRDWAPRRCMSERAAGAGELPAAVPHLRLSDSHAIGGTPQPAVTSSVAPRKALQVACLGPRSGRPA